MDMNCRYCIAYSDGGAANFRQNRPNVSMTQSIPPKARQLTENKSRSKKQKFLSVFSTSDISYQMCYWCRKLEICSFSWERMRERIPSHPLSCSKFSTSDWLRQIIWLQSALSHPLSHLLLHPLSCIRSRICSHPLPFVMWSVWAYQIC